MEANPNEKNDINTVSLHLDNKVYNLCFSKAIKTDNFEEKLKNCMDNYKKLIDETYYKYIISKK